MKGMMREYLSPGELGLLVERMKNEKYGWKLEVSDENEELSIEIGINK